MLAQEDLQQNWQEKDALLPQHFKIGSLGRIKTALKTRFFVMFHFLNKQFQGVWFKMYVKTLDRMSEMIEWGFMVNQIVKGIFWILRKVSREKWEKDSKQKFLDCQIYVDSRNLRFALWCVIVLENIDFSHYILVITSLAMRS